MSEAFKVGEVAILQNFTGRSGFNGQEVTVTMGLDKRLAMGVLTGSIALIDCYGVDIRLHGFELLVRPDQLRKKRPPTTGEQSIRDMFIPIKQPDLVNA